MVEKHGQSAPDVERLTRAVLFCCAVTGALFLSFLALEASGIAISLGPLSYHMGSHIWLMNLLAPLLAWSLLSLLRFNGVSGAKGLGTATALQIVALWAAHVPAVLDLAMASPWLHFAGQALLFATALYFWWTVMAQRLDDSWRSLFALLVTGKLLCLLGVLLVFAPRPLYPALANAHVHAAHEMTDAMADQQLAGLLMLIACPLSYVLAGTIIAARWLRGVSRELAAIGDRSIRRDALA